ncbi:MAG: multidrug efflux SMR transporter [Methylocystis sp.]|jgi:small multidrug resistance pump
MTPWVYLSIAILSEVAGTSALKATEGFRNFWPSVMVVVGYGMAFYFLSLTQSAIPMGVSYAVWSGVGVALISLVGWVYYKQSLGAGELIGIGMIVAGVVVLRVFSKNAG